jgi:hypothetical protein
MLHLSKKPFHFPFILFSRYKTGYNESLISHNPDWIFKRPFSVIYVKRSLPKSLSGMIKVIHTNTAQHTTNVSCPLSVVLLALNIACKRCQEWRNCYTCNWALIMSWLSELETRSVVPTGIALTYVEPAFYPQIIQSILASPHWVNCQIS